MKTQASRSHLPRLIVGSAVILFSTAGIAAIAIMGWLPASTDGFGGIVALDNPPVAAVKRVALTAQTAPGQLEGEARARRRCPGCGVIVSVREIERHDEDSGPGAAGTVTAGKRDGTRVKSARSYEIIVRMADGSSRVIDDANPASWRTGEHLVLIDGTNPSNK